MGKRFTDTDKWNKDWFGNLNPKGKLLWLYMCDRCDMAGVLEVNERLMSFQLGFKVSMRTIDTLFKGRIFQLEDNKIFILPFIEFQYGKLSSECRPHIPVIRTLEKYGLDYKSLDLEHLTPKQMRKRITTTVKRDVFARDRFQCQYCGGHDELGIDHIIPLTKGGTNEYDNLITACKSCNSYKGELSLEEFLEKIRNNETLSYLLDRVSNVLNRVSKKADTLEEKEKEQEQEKETKGVAGEKEPFADFWAVYPKQRIGNKDKARAAFMQAVKRSGKTPQEITAKASEYAASEEVARGFAKGAQAWLNDDRFLRTYAPAKTSGAALAAAREAGTAKIDEIFGGSK